jgi:hypothetical protein
MAILNSFSRIQLLQQTLLEIGTVVISAVLSFDKHVSQKNTMFESAQLLTTGVSSGLATRVTRVSRDWLGYYTGVVLLLISLLYLVRDCCCVAF